MFIDSKLVDMLGPLHCRNHHIQDRTLEVRETIQHVEQLLVSKYKDLQVGFCWHTLRVGNGRAGHRPGTERARET